MATESLYPTVIEASSGLTGAVTDIDDDPDSADANWLTASVNTSTSVRVSFPTPTGNLRSGVGLQQFRVRVRLTSINNAHGSDSVNCNLYENGSLVGSLTLSKTTGFTTDPGEVFTVDWNASLLSLIDGSNVEIEINGEPEQGGSPSSRGSIEIGAVEWVADYSLTRRRVMVI